MKFRQETDYAMRAIHALVEAGQKPLISKEIASNQNIPANYILTIMCKLKSSGFVKMVAKTENRRGGYMLAKDPYTITYFDVVNAFEGGIQINACLRDAKCCSMSSNCSMRKELIRINEVLISELKKQSIADIYSEDINDSSELACEC